MVVSEAMRMLPPSGSSSPASMRRSVVLPAPLGPARPMRSCFLTCQDTSSNRTRSPYRLCSPSTCIKASGRLRGFPELEEIQAGALDHLPVLGIEEAQAVLVDDLDLHALPFLPAARADRAQHPVLDRGGEGDAVAGGRFARLAAAHAGEGHVQALQNLSL